MFRLRGDGFERGSRGRVSLRSEAIHPTALAILDKAVANLVPDDCNIPGTGAGVSPQSAGRTGEPRAATVAARAPSMRPNSGVSPDRDELL